MHTIRLRDPWQCEQGEGKLYFRRRFQCPTNLEPSERVLLQVSALGVGDATLNGHSLGTWQCAADAVPITTTWPIEMLLQPSNAIELTFSLAETLGEFDTHVPGTLITSVQLIILAKHELPPL